MCLCWLCVWCVGVPACCVLCHYVCHYGLVGGGVWFLHVGSVSGALVCREVRGRVGGGVWFPRDNCMCGVWCVCVCV